MRAVTCPPASQDAKESQLPAHCFQSTDVIENLDRVGIVGECKLENRWLSFCSDALETFVNWRTVIHFFVWRWPGPFREGRQRDQEPPHSLCHVWASLLQDSNNSQAVSPNQLNSSLSPWIAFHSSHILVIQFSFLCYFWVLIFKKCVVICVLSGKLGEVEAGTSFKTEVRHIIF